MPGAQRQGGRSHGRERRDDTAVAPKVPLCDNVQGGRCAAIERRFPNIRKDEVLEDVDGSSYQIYYHSEGMIRVCNDYCLGDLYVEPEFDLLPYFKEDTQ